MIRERLMSLSQREQLMVGGLAAALALLLLTYGLIVPVLGMKSGGAARLEQAQRLASAAQRLEPDDPSAVDDRGLRSVVTSYADQRGVTYVRINQGDGGSLQLDLENVVSKDFYGWLAALEAEDITVSEAFVAGGETAGTVEARVTFVRSD